MNFELKSAWFEMKGYSRILNLYKKPTTKVKEKNQRIHFFSFTKKNTKKLKFH